MNRTDALVATLASGGTVLIDGATGTELERRGAPMAEGAWCALATETSGDLLRDIHRDYIEAGSRVITTNTFASCRVMLEGAGLGDRSASLIATAARLAREAREASGDDSVCIAGSLSHMVQVLAGQKRDFAGLPAMPVVQGWFDEAADQLAEGGVDLIVLEMMSEPVLAPMALSAALDTGLPVWVGLAVVQGQGGALVSRSRPEVTLDELLARMPLTAVQAAGVMHSDARIVSAVLRRVREHFDGPLMAYPDSGHFRMPNWQFEDVMPPATFADWCVTWRDEGTRILGGCCGLGVEHIRALASRLDAGSDHPPRGPRGAAL